MLAKSYIAKVLNEPPWSFAASAKNLSAILPYKTYCLYFTVFTYQFKMWQLCNFFIKIYNNHMVLYA